MHQSQLLLLLLLMNLDLENMRNSGGKRKNSKRKKEIGLNTAISTLRESNCGPTFRLAKPSTVQCSESTRAAEIMCAKKDLAVGFNFPPLFGNTAWCKSCLSLFREKRITVCDSELVSERASTCPSETAQIVLYPKQITFSPAAT